MIGRSLDSLSDPLAVARFWSKVDVGDGSACWPWQGPLRKGYGRFQEMKAHRLAYVLIKGPIPDGLVVRHLCHNKLCCNPQHLATGTTAQNAQDSVAANLQVQGSRHGAARLTEAQVAQIRQSDKTGRELASIYGVAPSTISYARRFKTYRPAP